jgi:hypothetical protein
MVVSDFIALASGLLATTYGHGESKCGVEVAIPCIAGARTASGEVLHADVPSVAIAAPVWLRIRARWIYLRTENSACHRVRLNDKMNSRHIGRKGFDLSPLALVMLTGKSDKHWSGRVFVCSITVGATSKKATM